MHTHNAITGLSIQCLQNVLQGCALLSIPSVAMVTLKVTLFLLHGKTALLPEVYLEYVLALRVPVQAWV